MNKVFNPEMKKSLIFLYPILFIVFVNVNSLLYAEVLTAGKEKKDIYNFTYGSIQGGEMADGLDVKNVRWGKHDGFERLVFDIYKWGGPTKPEGIFPNDYPGSFELKFQNELILCLRFDGYRAFSANPPDLYSSKLIEQTELEIGEYPADVSDYNFLIKLKKPVKLEVFELDSPARIVVDFKQTTQ